MEYEEGDIAEDGAGNFMVFRGGGWYRSDASGRPQERVPRPDYGPNHYELPNGDIVRSGPRGGQEVVQRAGGAGASDSALVGADARARFMLGLDALVEAERNLRTGEGWEGDGAEARPTRNPYTRDWGARALEAIPFDGGAAARIVGGQDYQDYEQASRTYESAMLPIFSGAAVTPTEATRLIRADLPQFGDSPETLRRKAMNRAMRINAVAAGIGRDLPYPEVGTLGPDGAVTAPSANMDDQIASPTEGGRDGSASGPVDISGMSAADLLQLEPGTEIRFPDGRVERLSARPVIGQEGEEVAPGVYALPIDEAARQAVAERRAANQVARRVDAGVRGAADMASLGFADEIAAGAGAFFGKGEGDTFMDRYRRNVAIERAIDLADAEDVPVSRGVGQVAGAVAGGTAALRGASRLPSALRVQQGQRIRNVARVGAGGAVTAGTAAAGGTEGDLVERGRNALAAAPVGAVAAPVAGQAVNVLAPHVGRAAGFLGDQANRGVRALGRRGWDGLERNALDTGADRLVQRGVNTNALADRAREFRDAGIDPTFADVTDSAGRGTLRALATRQTPARQMAEDFAEGRAEAMPSRLSFQARRTISDDMRSPDQIRGQLTEARSRQADQDYGAVQARVPVDDALLDAIGDEPGRAAIRAARAGAVERRDTATVQELDRLTDEIGLREQLSGRGVNATGLRREPLELSALTVERLRRAMGERGGRFARQGRNEQASGAFSRREAVESALDAVPDVAQARGNFRTASQQIEAVGTGEQFLGQNTDEFVAMVNAMTPEERRLARAGAARAIEVAGQNTGRAPGVARSLYANPEQARRSAALLGDDAGALQRGMRAESDALEASRQINPRSGSPTNLNQQDTAAAAGEAVGAVRDVATGNIGGLAMRVTRRLQSRGFSDAEADAIVRASIDPSRTDELIAMLSQRMSRREARNLLRSVRFAAAQNAGESTAQ